MIEISFVVAAMMLLCTAAVFGFAVGVVFTSGLVRRRLRSSAPEINDEHRSVNTDVEQMFLPRHGHDCSLHTCWRDEA